MTRSSKKSRLRDGRDPQRRRDTASKTPPSFPATPDFGSPSRPAARDAYAALTVCGFLLLAVGLLFGQTINHKFVNFDDNVYVYKNPPIARGLTADGIEWAFTSTCGNLWAPLTWSSYLLDSQLYGLKPGGYHLTNILLHAATTILLFLVLWRMTGDLWPSAFVAAVFAIHPQHVESVAWVAERKGLLSGLFFVLTLGAYLGYVRHRFSMVRYLTVALLFALGLMAKPALVTLPIVLLLLDYWPLGRMDTKPRPAVAPLDKPRSSSTPLGSTDGRGFVANVFSLALEKIPLLAIAALSCVVAVWAQGQALSPNELLSPYWRMGNALILYVVYLGQMFYPAGLAIPYPRPALDLPLWTVLGAFLVLAGITAAALAARRRSPYLLVGWLWFLAMLLPVIGLIQFGIQAMADRFTYLPQIGLCIVLAWGAAQAIASWPYRRGVCGVGSALVLAVLMACAWRQTTFWRQSEILWTRTVACTSRNALAHNNLALALKERGQIDEAIAHYQKSLEIDPNYAKAHNNLGLALKERGRTEEAMAEYREALKIKPDLVEARFNLANALAGRGAIEEAILQYRQGLKTKPDDAQAHYNFGLILAGSGRSDEAIAHYQQVLKSRPDNVNAHYHLGVALASGGRISEAIEHFQAALNIKPDYSLALNNLAWLRATSPEASIRNGKEAIELAQRAVQLSNGRTPDFLETLAAAYAEAGRFPEAVQTARKALELAERHNNQPLAKSVKARLRLYEAGTPYRESRSSPTMPATQP